MALGWLLHLGPNPYLLLGVPITLAFQLLIRRQPLLALWVREAPPFRLTGKGIAIACALALLPLFELLGAAVSLDWVGASQLESAVAVDPPLKPLISAWPLRACQKPMPPVSPS